METELELNEQGNYIIKKLKSVRSKLFQAYLVPFGIDVFFRFGTAALGTFIGIQTAITVGLTVLTISRIKAFKDLYDVAKGLLETEKLKDPTLTMKKKLKRDLKKLFKKDKTENNIIAIILGALAPMLFDFVSIGFAASYGAIGATVTQGIDTLLHLGSLGILFSNVKKINKKLEKFNKEYYKEFKDFVNSSLAKERKINIFNKGFRLRDVLNKEKTKANKEVIKRYLVDSSNLATATRNAVAKEVWEQFYLQFPTDTNAERSIRKQGNKHMVVTKIIEGDLKELTSKDFSRDTYTVEITKERYEEFKKLNGNNPIYNLTTYTIPTGYENVNILLDSYDKTYKGLNIARVKFNNHDSSINFVTPEWFEEEITTDPEYTGKHFPIPKQKSLFS